jgi:hypothetical protein
MRFATLNHALFKVNSGLQAGTVEVARSLSYNYTILDPKEYSGLHDFYQKVASADPQQLVLTRSAVAKEIDHGNCSIIPFASGRPSGGFLHLCLSARLRQLVLQRAADSAMGS